MWTSCDFSSLTVSSLMTSLAERKIVSMISSAERKIVSLLTTSLGTEEFYAIDKEVHQISNLGVSL